MEVLLSGSCDNVVMVGHEDDVVDEKVIFFMGFLQCLKEDTSDLSLAEPERSVVGPADQMVGVDVLYNPQWTSHGVILAKTLPTSITGGNKVL